MPLRLLVLGATGHIGTNTVELALARGARVTAFVRSPHKITRNDPNLTVIGGDPLSSQPLARALVGHDAVLSSLGLPPREALRPSTRMTEFAASTVAAMKTAGVKRLAIVSAAALFPDRRLLFRFFQWVLRNHMRDLDAMEAVVKATDLNWTIARPPRLITGSGKEEAYRATVGALPPRAFSMPFRSVARFLLDAVEQGTHLREVVGLGSEEARR